MESAVLRGQHVILTGPPGVGKSTLVQKALKALEAQQVSVFGFYTEEILDPVSLKRIGFDVVTTQGQRGTLARVCSKSLKRVGSYGVEVKEFEDVALPALDLAGKSGIVILDEIGKMEMFSDKFKEAVEKLFNSSDLKILSTIPTMKKVPIDFVEKIRHRPDATLFTINTTNRNTILSEIIATITGTEK